MDGGRPEAATRKSVLRAARKVDWIAKIVVQNAFENIELSLGLASAAYNVNVAFGAIGLFIAEGHCICHGRSRQLPPIIDHEIFSRKNLKGIALRLAVNRLERVLVLVDLVCRRRGPTSPLASKELKDRCMKRS